MGFPLKAWQFQAAEAATGRQSCCGNINNSTEIISLMQSLPILDVVEHEELLLFIEHNKMMGTGLGFVDVHLLAAAMLAGIPLWTQDKKLKQACSRLSIDFLTH